MPTTFSTDLRLELIGQGQQEDTWGITTNNNLGTLIEDAIAGVALVKVANGDNVLTAYNGEADQARCMILNLTSVVPTNAVPVVIAPGVTKMYIIFNGVSTGALNVDIGTAAGGNRVRIPKGYAKIVWCDGYNFLEASNSAQTFYLGSDPITDNQAATKRYVDTVVGDAVRQIMGMLQ